MDIAEEVMSERGKDADFIHMEIFEDNTVDKGYRPQVRDFGPAVRAVGVHDRPQRQGRGPPRGRVQRARAERGYRQGRQGLSPPGQRDERIEGLYGLPLESFTDARNGAGQGNARLRRPRSGRRSGAVEEADQGGVGDQPAARADEAAVRQVLEAGKRLRAAQEGALGGGSGTRLRDAAADEREAVDRATHRAAEAGGARLTGPNLERVRSSLHAAASVDEVRDAIEARRLTGDHEPIGLGSLAAVSHPAGGRPKETAS